MMKSSKKRTKREAETDAVLKNERASACRRKPLIRQPSNRSSDRTGATLGKLSEIWPLVKWCSILG
jgi:hypothetical protein